MDGDSPIYSNPGRPLASFHGESLRAFVPALPGCHTRRETLEAGPGHCSRLIMPKLHP
jgi:hypothetical protein